MRPVPFPERSARSWAVRSPVITQSNDVLPSPTTNTGSLLAIETMRVTGAGSTSSWTCAVTMTVTNLWFGGQSRFGDAATLTISGGVESTTDSSRERIVAWFGNTQGFW